MLGAVSFAQVTQEICSNYAGDMANLLVENRPVMQSFLTVLRLQTIVTGMMRQFVCYFG